MVTIVTKSWFGLSGFILLPLSASIESCVIEFRCLCFSTRAAEPVPAPATLWSPPAAGVDLLSSILITEVGGGGGDAVVVVAMVPALSSDFWSGSGVPDELRRSMVR